MSIVNRAKDIILSPGTEWQKIKTESTSLSDLLKGYVLPLAAISAAASFIGQGFIGTSVFGIRVGGTINYGIYSGLLVLLQSIIGFYITTYVIDMLAPNFSSTKNIDRSAQLVAYSYTPSLIGGIFAILPSISIIGALFGLYSLYLIYAGLPELKETPEDKRIGYVVVTILCLIGIYIVIGIALGALLGSIIGISAMSGMSII